MLFQRLQARDATALVDLADRYADALYRVAHAITRDTDDAGHVLRQVLGRVRSALAGLHEPAELTFWLYRATTDTALATCATRRLEPDFVPDRHLPAFRPDGHRAGGDGFVTAGWSGTPAETLVASARSLIERTLEEVPARHRAALVLRDVERLDLAAIAEILAEPAVAVQRRVHEARMAVREQVTRALHAPIAASAGQDPAACTLAT